MINKREVINLKLPFPNIDSGLARIRHMYICKDSQLNYSFVKSQTFKASILLHVKNYIVEPPNLARNPFSKKTLIDLDKEFHINKSVIISRESLCRGPRQDVCEELFEEIIGNTDNPLHKEFLDEAIIDLNQDYLSKVV